MDVGCRQAQSTGREQRQESADDLRPSVDASRLPDEAVEFQNSSHDARLSEMAIASQEILRPVSRILNFEHCLFVNELADRTTVGLRRHTRQGGSGTVRYDATDANVAHEHCVPCTVPQPRWLLGLAGQRRRSDFFHLREILGHHWKRARMHSSGARAGYLEQAPPQKWRRMQSQSPA